MASPHVIELPGGRDAPARARRAALDAIRREAERAGLELDEPLEANLRLLLSEVVANAVIHGGAGSSGSVRLAVEVDGERVWVAVRDPGPGFERGAPGREDGGFGLRIVESVARRWGIEARRGATTVWFELAPASAVLA